MSLDKIITLATIFLVLNEDILLILAKALTLDVSDLKADCSLSLRCSLNLKSLVIKPPSNFSEYDGRIVSAPVLSVIPKS